MEYQYYAFISYKREDEKWARWLQRKLEKYKLPVVLQNQYKLEYRSVKPVFRDKTDLATGTVRSALSKELEVSKYLIVICSPSAAKSSWVNMEIEQFLQADKLNYIIPFIIKGKPFADDPGVECFPPSLRSMKEPLLGININEVGKRAAFFRLVAGLLEIRTDDLIKREKRRIRNQRICAIAAGVMVMIVSGVFIWYYTPKAEYYADYVLENNIPVGIYPLQKSEVKNRVNSYRFIYKEFMLTEVDHINSDFQISVETDIEKYDRPPELDLHYNQYGQLSEIIFYNQYHEELMTESYGNINESFHQVIEFVQYVENETTDTYLLYSDSTSSDGLFGLYLDRRTNIPYTKSAIAEFELLCDNEQKVKEIHFLNRSGMKVCDAAGIYGVTYEYDALGRIVKIMYCDLLENELGGKHYTYTGSDVTCVEWINAKGELTDNSDGYACFERTYDTHGNCSTIDFYDSERNKVLIMNQYAALQYEYDEAGHISRLYYYDENENLLSGSKGVAQVTFQYDSLGAIVLENYFDENGEATANAEGVYGYLYTYETKKQLTKQCIDANNKPMSNTMGISSLKNSYGRYVEFYDINGLLTLGAEGCAVIQYDYGLSLPGSKITKIQYTTGYDKNRSVCMNKYGFAYVLRGYDDYDRLMVEEFYDNNDQVVESPSGYTCMTNSYDLLDNLVRTEYKDRDGNYVNGPLGFAVFVAYFDSDNFLTDVTYYNDENTYVMGPEGFARMEIQYNKDHLETARRYYGSDGQLCIGPMGFAELAAEITGDKASIKFFDSDGNLIDSIWGYAASETILGQDGTTKYYDKNGIPVSVGQ